MSKQGLSLISAGGAFCATSILVMSTPAMAQEATASTEASGEIVVTANRGDATSIQRTPLAVSALSGDDLRQRQVESLSDLSRNVPSLTVTERQPGSNRIDMRGVNGGTLDVTDAQDRPLVAVYLDDTPISQQGNTPDLKVFDLERVEVIRGPAGTLFGAGSMSGTIRYITAKPKFEKIFGTAEAEVSGTKHGEANYFGRATLNLPLSGNLAVRGSLYRGENSGYIDNLASGKRHANSDETTQFRVAARWQPLTTLTFDASVTYNDLQVRERNSVYTELGPFQYRALVPEKFKERDRIYNLAGQYEFGDFSLISSTSYLDRSSLASESFDYALAYLIGIPVLPAWSKINNKTRDFTQELRLVKKSDTFKFTLGGFYEKLHRVWFQDIPTAGFDAAVSDAFGAPFNSLDYGAATRDDAFTGDQDIKERQVAVFGEATLTLADRIDLTAGLRYFNWKQDFDLSFRGLAGAEGPGQPVVAKDTARANGFNPRFIASMRITPTNMIYAEAAKGFRYGGVNQGIPLSFCGSALAAQGIAKAPVTFGPDSLWNYEIGSKNSFFDRKLTLNGTAFLIDWSDVQTRNYLDCGYYFIQNQGKVRSKGLEVEAKARPLTNLSLGGTLAYTDSRAKGPIANAHAVDGDHAPYSPRWVYSLSLDWDIPVRTASIRVHGDFSHRDATYTRFNPAVLGARRIPQQNIANASITFSGGRWEFSLFVRNLTDERIISDIVEHRYVEPGDTLFIGRPRTLGFRTRLLF